MNRWQDDELSSPFSGKALRRDTPHSLTDGARRFPVIDEIPFLRHGRDELIGKVLYNLDRGNKRQALTLLLQDQDDWAQTPPPIAADLQPFFENKNLTLREAMKCLKYEAVADYFAYRWSDPTFLSGLKLLETHLSPNVQNVFELCCGIGHFLREFALRNIPATGADVVFSKLWLARKFIAPNAKLICFDANFGFPFAGTQIFETAFCHDAFYFLPEKRRIACELKKQTQETILIGHAHNAGVKTFSSGAAVTVEDYAALFDGAIFYDDAELTAAFTENRAPQAQEIEQLEKTEAVSLAVSSVRQNISEISFRAADTNENLRINPLLLDEAGKVCRQPHYPSERYRDEYAALSAYLNLSAQESEKLQNFAPKSLSEKEIENFMRRRILLDLPEKW